MSLALVVAVLLSAPPDDAAYERQYAEVIKRTAANDSKGAIALCRSVLEERPHDRKFVLMLATLFETTKVPPVEQIAFVEGELANDPSGLPELYAYLGTAQERDGELAKAETAYRKGILRLPKDGDLHFSLGRLLLEQQRLAEAEPVLQRAAQLNPAWATPWDVAARALEANGKPLAALMARARAVLLEPGGIVAKLAARSLVPLLTKAGAGPRDAKRSEGAFFVAAFSGLVQSAAEVKDPFMQDAVSPFVEAKAQGLLEAVSWRMRSATDDPEAIAWLKSHPAEHKKVDALLPRP